VRKILEAIAATAEIMGQSISPPAAVILAQDLSAYPQETILAALEETRKSSARFSAKAIFDAIEKLSPDGRPDANEAWAMLPKNEDASVVMSQEMAEALGVAQPLLDEGDAIGARMAFRDAYNRIVEGNKLAGVAPSWFPSLGRNAEMRVAALEQATRLGRIGYDHAAALLPPVQSAVLLENKKVAIEDKSGLSNAQKMARCAELKAMLTSSKLLQGIPA